MHFPYFFRMNIMQRDRLRGNETLISWRRELSCYASTTIILIHQCVLFLQRLFEYLCIRYLYTHMNVCCFIHRFYSTIVIGPFRNKVRVLGQNSSSLKSCNIWCNISISSFRERGVCSLKLPAVLSANCLIGGHCFIKNHDSCVFKRISLFPVSVFTFSTVW